MNKIFVSGTVIRSDPQTSITRTGKTQCKFKIAVRRKFKNAIGEYDADYFTCTAWGTRADYVAKYIKRGSKVIIVGALQTSMVEDETTGNKRFFTDIVVENIENYTWNDAPKETSEHQAPYMTGFTDLALDDTNEELPF